MLSRLLICEAEIGSGVSVGEVHGENLFQNKKGQLQQRNSDILIVGLISSLIVAEGQRNIRVICSGIDIARSQRTELLRIGIRACGVGEVLGSQILGDPQVWI